MSQAGEEHILVILQVFVKISNDIGQTAVQCR